MLYHPVVTSRSQLSGAAWFVPCCSVSRVSPLTREPDSSSGLWLGWPGQPQGKVRQHNKIWRCKQPMRTFTIKYAFTKNPMCDCASVISTQYEHIKYNFKVEWLLLWQTKLQSCCSWARPDRGYLQTQRAESEDAETQAWRSCRVSRRKQKHKHKQKHKRHRDE